MNCYVHNDTIAVGTCVTCSRPICRDCAIETNGRLVCRECLATGKAVSATSKDVNTAFLIELIGGFFGLLGLGYLYTGRTNEGVLRLIAWIAYSVTAYIIISLLIAVFIGVLCVPIQLIIQIGIPIWSATTLKNSMSGNV